MGAKTNTGQMIHRIEHAWGVEKVFELLRHLSNALKERGGGSEHLAMVPGQEIKCLYLT